MEVKCFVICTALLLPLKVNFPILNSNIYVIKIGIRIRDPDCKKSALEAGVQIRRFFGRIAIPGKYNKY